MSVVARNASTLAEIIGAVTDIQALWNPRHEFDQDLWFRGQAEQRFPLLPGLLRPSVAKYKYDEYTLLTQFRHLGEVHAPTFIRTNWDWYFLAQHYRLPTRLLDWTESLLAGIHFAIAGAIEPMERKGFDELLRGGRLPPVFDVDSPTVWMLDGGSLNDWSVGEDGIFSPDNGDIAGFCWDVIHDAMPAGVRPIALSPPRQSQRITAQRGMFTVHGTDATAIDVHANTNDPTAKIKLACITIDRANLPFLWQEVELSGYGRLALFPDLDSVAEHLKWVYQSY